MEIFDEDGHITSYGFQLFINGEPSELERLEISEHLGFCDKCLSEYLLNMQNISLISPIKSVEKDVLKAINKNYRKMFFSRYVMAAVAASVTMVLWFNGVFDIGYVNYKNDQKEISTPRIDRIISNSNKIFDSFTKTANEILENRLDFKEDK